MNEQSHFHAHHTTTSKPDEPDTEPLATWTIEPIRYGPWNDSDTRKFISRRDFGSESLPDFPWRPQHALQLPESPYCLFDIGGHREPQGYIPPLETYQSTDEYVHVAGSQFDGYPSQFSGSSGPSYSGATLSSVTDETFSQPPGDFSMSPSYGAFEQIGFLQQVARLNDEEPWECSSQRPVQISPSPQSAKKVPPKRRNMDHESYRLARRLGACKQCRQRHIRCTHHSQTAGTEGVGSALGESPVPIPRTSTGTSKHDNLPVSNAVSKHYNPFHTSSTGRRSKTSPATIAPKPQIDQTIFEVVPSAPSQFTSEGEPPSSSPASTSESHSNVETIYTGSSQTPASLQLGAAEAVSINNSAVFQQLLPMMYRSVLVRVGSQVWCFRHVSVAQILPRLVNEQDFHSIRHSLLRAINQAIQRRQLADSLTSAPDKISQHGHDGHTNGNGKRLRSPNDNESGSGKRNNSRAGGDQSERNRATGPDRDDHTSSCSDDGGNDDNKDARLRKKKRRTQFSRYECPLQARLRNEDREASEVCSTRIKDYSLLEHIMKQHCRCPRCEHLWNKEDLAEIRKKGLSVILAHPCPENGKQKRRGTQRQILDPEQQIKFIQSFCPESSSKGSNKIDFDARWTEIYKVIYAVDGAPGFRKFDSNGQPIRLVSCDMGTGLSIMFPDNDLSLTDTSLANPPYGTFDESQVAGSMLASTNQYIGRQTGAECATRSPDDLFTNDPNVGYRQNSNVSSLNEGCFHSPHASDEAISMPPLDGEFGWVQSSCSNPSAQYTTVDRGGLTPQAIGTESDRQVPRFHGSTNVPNGVERSFGALSTSDSFLDSSLGQGSDRGTLSGPTGFDRPSSRYDDHINDCFTNMHFGAPSTYNLRGSFAPLTDVVFTNHESCSSHCGTADNQSSGYRPAPISSSLIPTPSTVPTTFPPTQTPTMGSFAPIPTHGFQAVAGIPSSMQFQPEPNAWVQSNPFQTIGVSHGSQWQPLNSDLSSMASQSNSCTKDDSHRFAREGRSQSQVFPLPTQTFANTSAKATKPTPQPGMQALMPHSRHDLKPLNVRVGDAAEMLSDFTERIDVSNIHTVGLREGHVHDAATAKAVAMLLMAHAKEIERNKAHQQAGFIVD